MPLPVRLETTPYTAAMRRRFPSPQEAAHAAVRINCNDNDFEGDDLPHVQPGISLQWHLPPLPKAHCLIAFKDTRSMGCPSRPAMNIQVAVMYLISGRQPGDGPLPPSDHHVRHQRVNFPPGVMRCPHQDSPEFVLTGRLRDSKCSGSRGSGSGPCQVNPRFPEFCGTAVLYLSNSTCVTSPFLGTFVPLVHYYEVVARMIRTDL